MKGTLTTLILGAALAEFGLTGLQHEDGSSYQPAEQASAVYEQIVPISAYGPPPGMVMTSNAGIEQDVEAGVRQLDSGVRKLLTADLRNHPDRFDMSSRPSLP